ncbi:MAG: hypothetical protein V3T14_14215 [Myxococcota bacterium]
MERPLAEYESVATWREGLREQWGGDPLADEPGKLETLSEFCERIEKNPDELVAFCFLRRRETGEMFGSVKRREEIVELLQRFRAKSGRTGSAAQKLVNDVLSFLIHNGVLINPGMVQEQNGGT